MSSDSQTDTDTAADDTLEDDPRNTLPDINLEDTPDDEAVIESSQMKRDVEPMKPKKDFQEYVELESGGKFSMKFLSFSFKLCLVLCKISKYCLQSRCSIQAAIIR